LDHGWEGIEMEIQMLPAEVTKKVILFSRWQAAKLYEKELTKLIQDLSMEECSPKIRRIVGKTFEPYRVYLRPIRDKIRSTHQLIERHLNKKVSLDENKLLQDKKEILEPLRDIRESLNLYKGQHVGNSDLLDLIRRVRCFGINLARLDIRQESSRHEKLINEVIKKKHKIEYLKISESKKIDLFNSLIKQKKYFLDKINIRDKENKEVWNTFKQISREPSSMSWCLCNFNDIKSF
jgi:phosphoenolpyruvate carboxylase